MSECKHKWKYLNTWRKHVCQKCQKPMNVVDFSEYANQLEQERSTALAQVKERELAIEKVEAKCCQCHVEHVAQVAVLRKGMEVIADTTSHKRAVQLAIIFVATTPAEAAECVQALVKALESIEQDGWCNETPAKKIARGALVDWRGES